MSDQPDLLAELDAASIAAGHDCWCGQPRDICEDSGGCAASQHIERLESAITRVAALHKMMVSEPGGPAYCTEDSARWPCPTMLALEGGDA
jgi:hypothetical protein